MITLHDSATHSRFDRCVFTIRISSVTNHFKKEFPKDLCTKTFNVYSLNTTENEVNTLRVCFFYILSHEMNEATHTQYHKTYSNAFDRENIYFHCSEN